MSSAFTSIHAVDLAAVTGGAKAKVEKHTTKKIKGKDHNVHSYGNAEVNVGKDGSAAAAVAGAASVVPKDKERGGIPQYLGPWRTA